MTVTNQIKSDAGFAGGDARVSSFDAGRSTALFGWPMLGRIWGCRLQSSCRRARWTGSWALSTGCRNGDTGCKFAFFGINL